MGPRKRNVDKRVESEDVVKEAKLKAHLSAKKPRPFGVFAIVLVVSTISAGIYIYNFVDLTDTLDKLQVQFDILRGVTDVETTRTVLPEQSNDQRQEQKKALQEKEVKSPVADEKTKRDKRSSNADSNKAAVYKHADITNKLDYVIKDELDRADGLVQMGKPEDAIRIYGNILKKHPKSPRAAYGKATALYTLADLKRSNEYLEQSIDEYLKVFELPDVTKTLLMKTMDDCIKRQQFRGWNHRAAKTVRRVLEIYPDDVGLWNKLGVQYLMSNKNEDAREAFKHVLRFSPDDGFAKAHIGFILKTVDQNNLEAIQYLQEGISSGAEGVIDGRFFFHLGDALYRSGKHEEAYETYKLGSEQGVFMSMYQRSLYNVEPLTARPWWTLQQTQHKTQLLNLEKNWKVIRDEGLAQLDSKTGSFIPEEENLREKGDWKQFTLFQQGRKVASNCKKVPKTCALIEELPDAAGCKRGQVKYSVMQPGVHVWPHCGPTNCRIRAHLGLVIPEGPRIRVANDTRTWKEGEFIVFDDSFEHEVWHDGTETRLVLIVDLWHPDLTEAQKQQLTPI